ncbi:MAG: 50S ribosomal protein L13 [Candidatus Nanohaloarchaea archaeon]|nr:50S ribosomal protein L13 [Candidatus Nanohaloarchaea archaeon]
MIIDAKDHILGRLSTHVVSALKEGEEVTVINADKAIIKGDPEEIKERYKEKYEAGSRDRGPFFPKSPDRIVKRTVKGMLPKNNEGREMLGNLTVYKGTPENVDGGEQVDDALVTSLKGANFVRMEDVSAYLGA